jgi:hypothetical protein
VKLPSIPICLCVGALAGSLPVAVFWPRIERRLIERAAALQTAQEARILARAKDVLVGIENREAEAERQERLAEQAVAEGRAEQARQQYRQAAAQESERLARDLAAAELRRRQQQAKAAEATEFRRREQGLNAFLELSQQIQSSLRPRETGENRAKWWRDHSRDVDYVLASLREMSMMANVCESHRSRFSLPRASGEPLAGSVESANRQIEVVRKACDQGNSTAAATELQQAIYLVEVLPR